VATQYDLPLRSVEPLPMPTRSQADRLGDCSGTGDIRIVMRATVDGAWVEEPRTPAKIWETAAHELAHLRYMNHGTEWNALALELHEALVNQQESHREKIVRKLVKMQAQKDGEAALGNAEAAEAFAAAINRMLIEYELHPSDLDFARASDNDPVVEIRVDLSKYQIERKKRRIAWQETLARKVAEAHLCTHLISQGRNDIWFVGTRSHAMVAEYTYGILVAAVDKMAHQEYCRYWFAQKREVGHTRDTKGYKESWIGSFIIRIGERFDEARRAAVAQFDAEHPAPAGAQSVALVRLNGALVKVRNYIDDKFSSKRGGVSGLGIGRGSHAGGREAGRAAADRMAIGRKAVTGGSTGKRGLLR